MSRQKSALLTMARYGTGRDKRENAVTEPAVRLLVVRETVRRRLGH